MYVSSVDLLSIHFRFIMQEFSMVGGYMEDFKKTTRLSNWGVSACAGMDACLPGTIHSRTYVILKSELYEH